MDELMGQLMTKCGEFYTSARHLHMRGLSDVIKECIPIVEKIEALGKTFDDVLSHINEKTSPKSGELENDPFLNRVKPLFKMETK